MEHVDGHHGVPRWNGSDGWSRNDDLGNWSEGRGDWNTACGDEPDTAGLGCERTFCKGLNGSCVDGGDHVFRYRLIPGS